MEFDITPILIFAVGVLFALLSEGTRWLTVHLFRLKSQVPGEWAWLVDDLVGVGVKAAEQVYAGRKDAGAAKLDYVIKFVQVELKNYGLKFDRAIIEARIEAAVYEMKQGIKPE
jgi:hypothetical protein